MNRRALICVGCDTYEKMGPLTGAELDASRVFQLLVKPQAGDYDEGYSTLLLSPTLQDLRDTLRELMSCDDPVDTLTFYFAGHGCVHGGSLYLGMRDSDVQILSVSAFSLSELLRVVADRDIPQTNIVLDACHAGGLLNDLGSILKSDTLGGKGTPGVTLLAMAALDQYAMEEDGGGVGTNVLLDCISGSIEVQDIRPTLDLMEIGREVSRRFNDDAEQSPVCWGLILSGSSNFCRNPKIASDVGVLRSTLGDATPEIHTLISPFLSELWSLYLRSGDEWRPREFYELLTAMLTRLNGFPRQQALFIERVSQSFYERLKSHPDQSVGAELYAICATALLPHQNDINVQDQTTRLLIHCRTEAIETLERLEQAIKTDQYALLPGRDGGYEFFYLPIRLTKLLGWCGYTVLTNIDDERARVEALMERLTRHLLSDYTLSLTAMCDKQAGALAIIGAALHNMGKEEELAQLLSLFLSALSEHNGLIADAHITPDDAFKYLLLRATGQLEPGADCIARPTELVAVCLRLSRLANMQPVADDIMRELDHLHLNAYLPSAYDKAGDKTLYDGINVTMQIGHGVWTVDDFEAAWPSDRVAVPENQTERDCALLASLIFPDRVPWFAIAD